MLVAVRPLFSVTYFQFRENGKVVGEMERSLWRETAELDLDVELFKRSVKLRRPSILLRRFAVFEGGRRVGTINPAWLTGRAKIDLPPDWTVLDRVFFSGFAR